MAVLERQEVPSCSLIANEKAAAGSCRGASRRKTRVKSLISRTDRESRAREVFDHFYNGTEYGVLST